MNLFNHLLRRVFAFLAVPHETWAQQWLTRRAMARALQQFRTSAKRRKARPRPPHAWPVHAGRPRIGSRRWSKRR